MQTGHPKCGQLRPAIFSLAGGLFCGAWGGALSIVIADDEISMLEPVGVIVAFCPRTAAAQAAGKIALDVETLCLSDIGRIAIVFMVIAS